MKRIVLLVVIVPVLLFIVQNFQFTELRFLVWRVTMPHALLLILVLGAGILLGWILHAILAGGSSNEVVESRDEKRR